MARRRAADVQAEEVAEGTTGGLQLAVRASTGVQRAERKREDNPTTEAVRQSAEEGRPLAFDLPSEEEAKKVMGLLQRAAQDLGLGLSKSVTEHSPGVWTVDFEATSAKRERKYTTQEIREWYSQTFQTDAGPAELSGPVPREVRAAYRIANGYDKGEITLHGAEFKNA